ncbi:MAG: ABC transporter permease [Firmicutes bacterium]|nr:ABC transporter permease [Bacillota bacterium]
MQQAAVKTRKKLPEEFGIFLGLVAIYVIFAILCNREGFLTYTNTMNIARQISMITIIALGMTFVIISGGIDLSVGSIVALTGVFAAMTLNAMGGNIPLAIAVALASGLIIGAFNGLIIAHFRVPPFIVTLSTMIAFRGLVFLVCGGRPVGNLPESFFFIGGGYLILPVPVIIMAVAIVISWFLTNHTKFGRYTYAIGGNEEAARFSGINIKSMKVAIYSLCGLAAAISGVILTSRLFSGDPKSGQLYELDAIAAVVVGGTSLNGGKGTILGTLLGSLIIGVISNGLNLMGVESYTQNIIKGAVILIAVLLDQMRK